MATFRNVGTIGNFEEKMIGHMIGRGYDPEFARNCFDQIKGFGCYGFPESHAASFAQLVYVSSWLKHYHPDAFCCGLLNLAADGLYAPAQIVGDARKNGVEVREIDVSCSFAQNTLEERRRQVLRRAPGLPPDRRLSPASMQDEEEASSNEASVRGARGQREPESILHVEADGFWAAPGSA